MATTTSNFSWPIPQSTDLVKDGATAIASLGSGIDTSMAELKGGTTGQILSKTSGTDMDFTWITPNPGDITGVTAGTGLTGGGTSGDVTVSIDPTYYLLANQTRRNPILNSNFSVWQRGTSIAIGAGTYTADRWMGYNSSSVVTVSRQATSDTTNLPNIQYCARVQRNSGATATTSINFGQPFETVNSIPFAGKQITFSFYARKGANYSGASDLLYYYVQTGTGTDQNSVSGSYTGGANTVNSTATLTTTWQRFTATATIPTTTTEIGLQFSYNGVGTAGAADYFEITGVQLELGSVANTYMPNQPTYQGELAACRYYYKRNTAGSNYGVVLPTSSAASTTAIAAQFADGPMRVAPTSVEYSNICIDDGNAVIAITNVTNGGATSVGVQMLTLTVTGATQFRPYRVAGNNNAAGYIAVSAEL